MSSISNLLFLHYFYSDITSIDTHGIGPNSCGFASQRSSDQRGHLWYPEAVATGSTGSWEPKWAAPKWDHQRPHFGVYTIFDGGWICDDMCAHVIRSYVVWFHSICSQIRTFEEICAPAYVIPTCTNHSVQIKSNSPRISKVWHWTPTIKRWTITHLWKCTKSMHWCFTNEGSNAMAPCCTPKIVQLQGFPKQILFNQFSNQFCQDSEDCHSPKFHCLAKWHPERLRSCQTAVSSKGVSKRMSWCLDTTFIYLHIARAVGNCMSLSYVLSLEFFRVANRRLRTGVPRSPKSPALWNPSRS